MPAAAAASDWCETSFTALEACATLRAVSMVGALGGAAASESGSPGRIGTPMHSSLVRMVGSLHEPMAPENSCGTHAGPCGGSKAVS